MDIQKFKKAQGSIWNVDNSKKENNKKSIFDRDIIIFNRFGNKDKEYIFSEITMLLSSGIDLQSALELCKNGNIHTTKYEAIYTR